MPAVPLVELNDGRAMPALGFGTYDVHDANVITEAIRAGYRLLDTAASYENEAEVGRAIADSAQPRGDLFVTTKLRGAHHGRTEPLAALEGSLGRLGLDHVDLYLMHWPLPKIGKYVETWQAMIDLRAQGLATSIGVSNFLPDHLDRIVNETGVLPVVNQVELHPYFQQPEQRAAHARHGILTQSWSPLGRMSNLMQNPVIAALAGKHGVDPGQVVLRWHVQIGAVPVPKSVTPSRFRSNLEIFDFELDDDDLDRISGLDTGHRIAGDQYHPATWEEF